MTTTDILVPLRVRINRLLDESRLTEAILDNPEGRVLVIDRREYASFETILSTAVRSVNAMPSTRLRHREPAHLVVDRLADVDGPLPPADRDDPGTVEFVVAHVRRSRGDQWAIDVATRLKGRHPGAFRMVVKEDDTW